MARITCDDCLKHIDNRYDLVLAAAERVKHLVSGLQQPLTQDEIDDDQGEVKKDKYTVIALREIAEGLITQGSIKEVSDKAENETQDLDMDTIASRFEEVDRQIEEERIQAEEKGSSD